MRAVLGDVDVDDAAGRRARALAARLLRVGEVLVAGAEQVGDGRERLHRAGPGVELVQVGSEVARRRAAEQHRAVAGDRERGGEAEAEVERRGGVGEEFSIEGGPGHGLGGSAGGQRDHEREERAGGHRGG